MSEENALPAQEVALTAMPTVDDVIEALKDVIDPELMVNVVDLGLVYGVNIDDEGSVTIDMTLTSPTCPLTDRLEYDTQTALAAVGPGAHHRRWSGAASGDWFQCVNRRIVRVVRKITPALIASNRYSLDWLDFGCDLVGVPDRVHDVGRLASVTDDVER